MGDERGVTSVSSSFACPLLVLAPGAAVSVKGAFPFPSSFWDVSLLYQAVPEGLDLEAPGIFARLRYGQYPEPIVGQVQVDGRDLLMVPVLLDVFEGAPSGFTPRLVIKTGQVLDFTFLNPWTSPLLFVAKVTGFSLSDGHFSSSPPVFHHGIP